MEAECTCSLEVEGTDSMAGEDATTDVETNIVNGSLQHSMKSSISLSLSSIQLIQHLLHVVGP